MELDLVKKIRELNSSKDFDCLLKFSGGKDSSYLLYYLAHELGLKVATVTLTHNYLSEETRDNIDSFTRRYSAKHIFVENHNLNSAAKHFLEAWINKPEEGSLITMCTGCRLGLVKPVIEVAKREGINIVITGTTPYEATDYRLKLVNYPKGKEGKFYFFLGYLRLILRNPSLISNIKALKCQILEYYYNKNQKKIFKQHGLVLIHPFYSYLNYNEELIIQTLNKLEWKKDQLSKVSYWRADCQMNAIRQFFYNWISGYNENEMYYGRMLKDQLISKEYYDKNIQLSVKKEDIYKVLLSLDLSEKALKKYEKFLVIK